MESVAHPKTEVSFAPTRAFLTKYGAQEAAKQRQLFERPTWASKCKEEHPDPIRAETQNPPHQLNLYLFVAGIAVGALCMWVLTK